MRRRNLRRRTPEKSMKGGEFMSQIAFALLSGGGSSTGDLAGILSAATQLVTWIITTLGSFLTFIVDNPVILVLFLMMIVSFAIGVLFRIWRSTGI